MTTEEQKKALEDLLRSEEFEKIKNTSSRFNVFRALGLEEMEIRHSQFLAWLLNPKETHGLNDYALREFLKLVSLTDGSGFTIFDLDGWDLEGTEVITEWNNIDILLKNEEYKFVCVIENKIGTQDHDGQLNDYKKRIDDRFKDTSVQKWKRSFLYLTPHGDAPLDDKENVYINISYDEHIIKLIEKILARHSTNLSVDVLSFITHYKNILLEKIMENTDIKKLCREIYRNNKVALDLIIDNRPDVRYNIADILTEMINEDGSFEIIWTNYRIITFFPKAFNNYPFLKFGEKQKIIMFNIDMDTKSMIINARLAAGEQKIRQIIWDTSLTKPELFHVGKGKLSNTTKILDWESCYENYDDATLWSEEKLRDDLAKKWTKYKIRINKMLDILLPEFDKFKE